MYTFIITYISHERQWMMTLFVLFQYLSKCVSVETYNFHYVSICRSERFLWESTKEDFGNDGKKLKT